MKPTKRVSMGMKHFVLAAILLAACGPKHSDGIGNSKPDEFKAPPDTRSAIDKRRDTACETLGPRMTACAVEDAKAELAAGKTTQKQFDQDTASGIQKKNTEEFVKA